MTDKKTIATPTPAVTLTVIGAGDGLVDSATGKTPPDQPNVVIKVISPLLAVLIRFVNFYGASLLGMVAAAMTPQGGKLLYTSDFFEMLFVCASLALPGAILDLLYNVLKITQRLETKYPLLSGGV